MARRRSRTLPRRTLCSSRPSFTSWQNLQLTRYVSHFFSHSWTALIIPHRQSYATILDATAERQVEAFEPELKGIKTSRGDVWPATVLPGDPEHSQTGKLLALLGLDDGDGKRRHRTFVLMPTRIPGKKPPPGLTVVGELAPYTPSSRGTQADSSALRPQVASAAAWSSCSGRAGRT